MIGYFNILKAQILAFIQSLDILKFDSESLVIGMIDSVDGNDSLFVKSYCFKGNSAAYFNLTSNINITETDSWEFELNFTTRNVGTAQIYLGNQASNTPYLYISNDTVIINLGVTVFNQSVPDILNVEKFRCRFGGDGTGNFYFYYNIPGGAENTISVANASTFNVNFNRLYGRLTMNLPIIFDDIHNASFKKNGTIIHRWTHSAGVNVTGEIEYDVIGNNNGTLAAATLANRGEQDDYHYLQTKGAKWDGINQIVPANETGGNPADEIGVLNYVQNGKRWLRVGNTKMKNADVQVLKDNDGQNVWFDGAGLQKEVTDTEYANAVSGFPDNYGGNVTAEYIDTLVLKKKITHNIVQINELLNTTLLTENTELIS